ncbi:MAG: hypothetical protein QG673_1549 [Pseudomonadota bacterium]|nr:hypothetical protein [Pseudomonadota bacterium]
MKKKFVGGVLLLLSGAAASMDNSSFQQFENEYNLGYGYQGGQLIDGNQNTSSFNAQSINLEVERLFDIGIWLDGNFNMVTDYSQPNLGSLNGGDGSGDPFGQDPFMFSLTAKVGYAFQTVDQHLQLIPYAMFGRTVNWATSTVIANGGQNLTGDYFYTGGLGGRISYRINQAILVYADELYTYNWDNSGAVKSIQSNPDLYGKSYAATNYTFTSTVGAKFNVYKDLQLGVNGFWNNYQPQSNISGIVYTPTNTFGGMVSVGLTY